MTLSGALSAAQSSLATTAGQTALLSRNIAGAGNTQYSRKLALVARPDMPGVQLVGVGRAEDRALLEKLLGATSAAAGERALSTGLDRLSQAATDAELGRSIPTQIAKLTEALEFYAATPADAVLAQSAVTAAGGLAEALNTATREVQGLRQQADVDIVASVERINGLLADFERLNGTIVAAAGSGRDVTDALDSRDAILAQLSEEIGIAVVRRGSGDMAIYTEGGATLFEKSARPVTFQPTSTFTAGVAGQPLRIDGMAVGGGNQATVASGRLAGLLRLRDDVAVTYQAQLDEVARGLIDAFAESDQSATPTLPDVPGLFTWPGAPAMPGGGVVAGLAGAIRINPNVDPAQGGDAFRLRDGGISGNAAYVYNPSGAAAFADRLQEMIGKLAEERAFDPAAGAAVNASLTGFAGSSVGWLEASRKGASENAEFQATLLSHTSEALSNATGVNLDQEMSLMLDLEHTYQATAKLISAVDALFGMILEAVG